MIQIDQQVFEYLEKNPFAKITDLQEVFPELPVGTCGLLLTRWKTKLKEQQDQELEKIREEQNENPTSQETNSAPNQNPYEHSEESQDNPSAVPKPEKKKNLPPAVAKNKPFFQFLLENQKELAGLIQLYKKYRGLPKAPTPQSMELGKTKKRTHEIDENLYKEFASIAKDLKITNKKALNLALRDFIDRYQSD